MSTSKTINIHHKSLKRACKPKQLEIPKFKGRLTAPHIMPKWIEASSPNSNTTNQKKETHALWMNFYNLVPWEPWGWYKIHPSPATQYFMAIISRHNTPHSTPKRQSHFSKRAVLKWHIFLIAKLPEEKGQYTISHLTKGILGTPTPKPQTAPDVKP